ncbi:MAG: UDP-N-acetylmuramoyl-L-alanine--D-glutamate ligase [Spirochaetales bacterium]|nr:UDP-N-acetylmuramoyl-L-alanine--D-glutamate ligase [Spirochaetales bacterium]
MGLGLHGGGAAAARFFAARGCRVTVTDLRNAEVLSPSIQALADLPVRFVLGKHPEELFTGADLVIKNPAVPPSSPLLKLARRIETDISVFLRYNTSPVVAVTGSKGKSTTASAIHFCLKTEKPDSRLGGNITVSPLTFLDEEDRDPLSPVVLELSSWQLADLKASGLLKPAVAVLTIILPDHLDRYGTMEAYVADKRLIYRNQTEEDYTLCLKDDPWGRLFYGETPGHPFYYTADSLDAGEPGLYLDSEGRGFIRRAGREEEILPPRVRLPGRHNRINLLAAGGACALLGMEASAVGKALAEFPGIEHRLEYLSTRRGVDIYNDSAATIPEAAAAGVLSFQRPVVLLAGGTDKELDFGPFLQAAKQTKGIALLAGTATDKLLPLLKAEGITPAGPYAGLDEALLKAFELTDPGDVLLFSPGCTSFGMFLNEFDRGRKFKAAVNTLPD